MQLDEGSVVGHYVLGPPLGAGGVAVVYRARHQNLGSEHAIKLILVPRARDRVLQEGRVQAKLRHPNIVVVTDYLVIRGTPALVMEYVDGPTLERLLERHRLSLHQVDLLADGLFAGVAAAHQQKLVHRDLKPSNILLARTESGFVPKIADFGLVKVLELEKRAAVTNATMGTPAYMAPEQYRDTASVDHRADIFGLGCVLYEMVTGYPAFDGRDPHAIQRLVSAGDYRPIAELAPSVPVGVMTAIDRAMSPDPELRPGTVEEMRALWFAGRAPPSPVGAWPEEWLREDWTPPPADLAGLTWDSTTEEARPGSQHSIEIGFSEELPTEEYEPEPRVRWRWGLITLGLAVLAAVATGGWMAVRAALTPVEPGGSALGLTPSDDLRTVFAGRERPFVVALAPLRAVGVEDSLAGSLGLALTELLRSTPGVELKTAAFPADADVDQWLVVGRRANADAVLVGTLGERDGDTVVLLQRVDMAGGKVRSRQFAVLGKDVAKDLEVLAARTLSTEESRSPTDVVLGELARRQAEMEVCKPKRGSATIKWRGDEAGTAHLVSADNGAEICARHQLSTWVLPPGATGEFTWTIGP